MKVICIDQGWKYGRIIEIKNLGSYSNIYNAYVCWDKYWGHFYGTPFQNIKNMKKEIYKIIVAVPETGRQNAIIIQADPFLRHVDFFNGDNLDDHLDTDKDYGDLGNDPGLFECKVKVLVRTPAGVFYGESEPVEFLRIIKVKDIHLV